VVRWDGKVSSVDLQHFWKSMENCLELVLDEDGEVGGFGTQDWRIDINTNH
jgi:hypothetical protein